MAEPVNPTQNDRLLSAFRALVRAELPNLDYYGVFEYVVQSSDGKTVNCDLDDTTVPLPSSLSKVPIRCWATVTPSKGDRCLIGFINADPTRPVCLHVDSSLNSVAIAAGSALGVAYPATEHVATVEGVVAMLMNFIILLYNAGAASTWTNPGKILDSTDPTLTQLGLAFQTMLNGCNTPTLPLVTPSPASGGIIPPVVLLAIVSALGGKFPDLVPGLTPTGIGAPNVKTG